MSVATINKKLIRVPIAGLHFAEAQEELSTLLGSCVGITIWCKVTKQGAMAHAMLDQSHGDNSSPGRFVDTAVPALIEGVLQRGAKRSCLEAKLTGGAQMFSARGVKSNIGLHNCELAQELLKDSGVKLVAEHVGGTQGRVINFDLNTGKVEVIVARKVVATL